MNLENHGFTMREQYEMEFAPMGEILGVIRESLISNGFPEGVADAICANILYQKFTEAG